MKKKVSYLIVFLIIGFTNSYGQISNHFEDATSKWYVTKSFADANPEHLYYTSKITKIYGFQGDSVLNGQLWQKLYATEDQNFNQGLQFKGWIRQNGNLTLFKDLQGLEDTLYNFDLSLGDSVLYNFAPSVSKYIHVNKIDSVLINGVKYKRIAFDEPQGINAFDLLKEVWIEGIGSVHGPLFPHVPRKFSTEIVDSLNLTCTYVGGLAFWHHQGFPNCYNRDVLETKLVDLDKIKVFPNPFNTTLNIDFPMADSHQIIIQNAIGNIVKKIQTEKMKTTIDFSTLASGFYQITIKSDLGIIRQKLIKN